jgi:hypothetical protein
MTELQKLDQGLPIQCPKCGRNDVFTVDPKNGASGYCKFEDVTWVIERGPLHPTLSKEERERRVIAIIADKARQFVACYDEFENEPGCYEHLMELVNATDLLEQL